MDCDFATFAAYTAEASSTWQVNLWSEETNAEALEYAKAANAKDPS